MKKPRLENQYSVAQSSCNAPFSLSIEMSVDVDLAKEG